VRGRLFVIIAFGETILTTGAVLTAAPYEAMTLLTSSVALTGTVALFWIFFSRSEHVVRHYHRTEDPMRAGRTGVISLMVSVATATRTAWPGHWMQRHPGHSGVPKLAASIAAAIVVALAAFEDRPSLHSDASRTR
jgi:4-amino-4-deoxy-L-arabinose transferase-like glycosyltransferase